MSHEENVHTEESEPINQYKNVLTWVQIIVGIIIIISTFGNLYAYQYKAEEMRIWQNEFAKRFADYEKEKNQTLSIMGSKLASLEAKYDASHSVIDTMQKHTSDKSIHVSEDQVKNMVAAQLTSIQVNLTEMKTKLDTMLPSQQKQLDRIEDMLKQSKQAAVTGR